MSDEKVVKEFLENFQEDDQLMVMFIWNGKHGSEFVDENLVFRRQVLMYFENFRANFPCLC